MQEDGVARTQLCLICFVMNETSETVIHNYGSAGMGYQVTAPTNKII